MIEADLAYQIDNMEGMSIHRTARGETIITIVSDDNFSVLQRNLLLQFAVVGSSVGAAIKNVHAPARGRALPVRGFDRRISRPPPRASS